MEGAGLGWRTVAFNMRYTCMLIVCWLVAESPNHGARQRAPGRRRWDASERGAAWCYSAGMRAMGRTQNNRRYSKVHVRLFAGQRNMLC